jgi:hypothetical protein
MCLPGSKLKTSDLTILRSVSNSQCKFYEGLIHIKYDAISAEIEFLHISSRREKKKRFTETKRVSGWKPVKPAPRAFLRFIASGRSAGRAAGPPGRSYTGGCPVSASPRTLAGHASRRRPLAGAPPGAAPQAAGRRSTGRGRGSTGHGRELRRPRVQPAEMQEEASAVRKQRN